ncbi:SusC/RagA family TonB-linked outer membrane protein [Autumnicola musiva]|uniref:SusC/RagA family TonB-linked outer membrane protein n=1 Tax=Autumnicola musiva TaxID=3075589 RepID=A0ABU3D4S8_9FLAO|nr:SusC/RagA family TonB-linked outer membrane protein [Zunongwangia sp. F117]MDT0676538.1 SusC/RagA family TonB-linked outer membrane protein [Zunongwangia sp. F117]
MIKKILFNGHLPRKKFFLFLFLISAFTVHAQNITVSGVVSDANATLPGVTVLVRGTSNGAVTNLDGYYELNNVPVDATLQFTYVGFQTEEVPVDNKSEINVQLEVDEEALAEVIIVGYGRQTKKSVVGAITQTTGEVLQRTGGVTNIGQALTGQLPGVITTSSTGQPGAEDPNIVIRAQTSWNNSNPLILVDGIERSMSDVDISSVATISVLKDASATAVYGVRGANGVILITTKRGVEGKASIGVRVNSTMKMASKLPEKYDSYGALMLRNQAIERELALSPVSWEDYTPVDIISKYRYPANLTEAERYANVNWEDVLFKDFAMAYNASANVSGGTELVKYFANINFLNEGDLFKTVDNAQGYQPGFDFSRINVRTNLDFQLTNTTKFSTNLFGSNGVRQEPWNFSGSAPWGAAYTTAPDAMIPYYTSTNTWGFYQPHDAAQPNSLYFLGRGGREKITQAKITTDFRLEQDLDFLTEGLSFEALYSYDNTFQEVDRGISDNSFQTTQRMWVNPDTGEEIYAYPIDASTQLDFVNQRIWNTNPGVVNIGGTYRRQYYSPRLNYARDFGGHYITLLGMMSREKYSLGSEFAHFREDWVFRGTYAYEGKYFFEVNGAYNGTEKYGPANRFAFFPSLSAGWMLTEENFMQSLNFIDMFKIRGSWGQIGDESAGGRFLYADQWNYGGRSLLGQNATNESPYVYFVHSSIGNPSISWESVEKVNIGADFSILSGLIEGEANYFWDHRTDIVMGGASRAVPTYFGAVNPTGNIGEAKGSGYELEIRLNKQINSDLTLWANTNFTHAKSKILFADDPELYPDYQKRAGYHINQTHSYIDAGYLSGWDDVLGSTLRSINNDAQYVGDYNIVDFNADGVIDNYDVAPYQYTTTPQNTYSSTIGLDWKGLNFTMQFYGVSNVNREVFFPTFFESNNNAYVEGSYWTADGGGEYPMPRWLAKKGDEARGTRYWYDGSYVRLKTAELGYTIGNEWTNRVGIRSLRFFLSGNNLFLWTELPDDRESNFSGNSRTGAYPTMRRVTLGFDITL